MSGPRRCHGIGSGKFYLPHLWISANGSDACERQTCQALRSIVHQRSVWTGIVRSVCKRRHLFMPCYPVDDMDLSHLQRAAVLPHLWNRLFEKESLHPMELRGVHPLHAATFGPQWLGHGVNAYLAPGGRFCVTFQNTGADTVSFNVWDLGAPGRSPLMNPRLVTSRIEKNGSIRDLSNVWASFWANQGDTLSLAVSQSTTTATGGECTT